MKVSREQMAQNRTRILDAASRLFRERGFDAVTVSEVMNAAGLTHGGFYGHFSSKDDLIAHALTHALAAVESETEASEGSEDTATNFRSFVAAYLSPHHRDSAETGCPTASLASGVRHQSASARSAMTQGLRHHIEQLTDAIPGVDIAERRRAAIGSWAAMVGAVILARAIDNSDLSDEILAQTREWIDHRA